MYKKLSKLGFNPDQQAFLKENDLSDFSIGRVTKEHKERYIVSTGEQEYEAEIMGNLRYSAISRADFPAVGDWVTMTVFEGSVSFINQVLPRKNVLERQAVGKKGEKQIISANINEAFIIQSIGENFSVNRFERYLTICNSSKINPVFVLTKIDLATEPELKQTVDSLLSRHNNVKVFCISNETKTGLNEIEKYLQAEKTYCFMGSSGVGKSTLINNLLGSKEMKTGAISESSNKGKHVTSHRELFLLANGAIVIDTPGMRELGITDDNQGLQSSFSRISELAINCKFSDCTHENEDGCEVILAVKNGNIDSETLVNFKKMEREQSHFTSSIAEKRHKDKQFGKMVKEVLKNKPNKY